MPKTIVTYNPQPMDGGPCLRCILLREEGVVYWIYVGDLERPAALDLVYEVGGPGIPSLTGDGGEDDELPGWFLGVDLVQLRDDVDDMLHAEHADRRDWYAAPRIVGEAA